MKVWALLMYPLVGGLLVCIPGIAMADDGESEDATVEAGPADLVAGLDVYQGGEVGKETPRSSDAVVDSLPACNVSTPDVECRSVVLCEADDASDTGFQKHVYSQERVHGHAYMNLGPCEPSEAAPRMPAAVARAFQRIPLPASQIVVQPPGGKTLVNFDTIFSTRSEPFTRPVRLLGRRIELKIWASSFTWRFGDERTLTTDHAGRAYERGLSMDAYITHQFVDAGVTVRPSVDTTYSAEFRVDGGEWRLVDGTVTIEGESASLRVVEARPVLVGSD